MSVDPATGQPISSRAQASAAEVQVALERAQRAAAAWEQTGLAERAAVLAALAPVLRAESEALARLMAREMGKPLPQGRAEIEKCASACEYLAATGPALLADEPVRTEAARSFVSYRPLGVLLAIMPWNFPFWQVLRAAAPALLAGNAVLLKHSSNVQGCAGALTELLRGAFRRHGLPPELAEGLFTNLPIAGARASALIAAPQIAAVTLTGSTPAGREVAAAAGAALKPCVLELGGSDPYLVLADADLELAAEACATSRLINAGQSCIAAKRMIVVREVLAEFTEAFVAAMARRRSGAPLAAGAEADPDLGPLARHDLRDALHDQVLRSVARGARCLLGGDVPAGPGAFYPPTVLADVRPGQAAFDEETFGPVAALVPARDEDEALRLAAATPFGLGAAVFTRDAARGERLAKERLQAGSCFVNDFVRSDPRLPFGGIKASGFGRELAAQGLREFVNVKTVWVR
ncbi:MAG: aldehyde dehydrogenase family protein [Planctomycetota bacterium]